MRAVASLCASQPENVLLDADGNVLLTDFGLSKEGVSDNISAHSFCGTPEYLAPEILTRQGHGRAADWWSLGAILYEMVVGMPPFYSRQRDRLFQKILSSSLRMPRSLSDECRHLLMCLLDRNPSTRIGSRHDAMEVTHKSTQQRTRKQAQHAAVPKHDRISRGILRQANSLTLLTPLYRRALYRCACAYVWPVS